MMNKKKVIVIGAGPAGIMAAITASNNNEVILIEKNDEIGKKLKLTGGGRCNITNKRDIEEFFSRVVTNSKFLYSSFYNFTNEDLLSYLDECDFEYKVECENNNKVYTKNDRADDIINMFKSNLIKSGVKIIYNKNIVDLIIEDNVIKGVKTQNDVIYGDKVIVTTGGKSYPTTGSDGSMLNILSNYGHKINELYPALVPLVIKEDFVKKLQGISMKDVVFKAKIKKKNIEVRGDMIFTHFGISGPGVLILSSYINKALVNGEIEVTLDFLKDKSKDEIASVIRSNPNKTVLNNLKGVLTQNFLKEIIENLQLTNTKAAELKKADEIKLIEMMKEMKLTVRETLSIKAAQVTSGGVAVKEINASTMESKLISGLYFAGEVIDVDAETGGFNLQIAFSTGVLAGSDY